MQGGRGREIRGEDGKLSGHEGGRRRVIAVGAQRRRDTALEQIGHLLGDRHHIRQIDVRPLEVRGQVGSAGGAQALIPFTIAAELDSDAAAIGLPGLGHLAHAIVEAVPAVDEGLVMSGGGHLIHIDEQRVFDMPADRQTEQLGTVVLGPIPIEILRLFRREARIVDAGGQILESVARLIIRIGTLGRHVYVVGTLGGRRANFLRGGVPLIQTEFEGHIRMQSVEPRRDVLLVIEFAVGPWADQEAHLPLQAVARGGGRLGFRDQSCDGGCREAEPEEPRDEAPARKPACQIRVGERTGVPIQNSIHSGLPVGGYSLLPLPAAACTCTGMQYNAPCILPARRACQSDPTVYATIGMFLLSTVSGIRLARECTALGTRVRPA